MSDEKKPVIIVDTREQVDCAWTFGGRVETTRGKLDTGDYSLLGYAPGCTAHKNEIVVERKTMADFIGSLTQGRDRFLAECGRLMLLPFKAIIVEGDFKDLCSGEYRSMATPQSLVGSTIKLMTDYGIPVLFAGTRAYAERVCERMLTRHFEKFELTKDKKAA